MAKGSVKRGIIKDIAIVAIGVLAIWIGLQFAFGTQNPFYVVSSGSMVPVLEVYDVLVVSGHVPFEEIRPGDIIVFDRPSGHDRVIVHRVAAIIDDNPKTIRTKGDANPASIPGTDFPVTEKEYIGKVAYVVPEIGYITQVLRPPINYIIIVIVIGVMVAKQLAKKKREKELTFEDPFEDSKNKEESSLDLSNLDTDEHKPKNQEPEPEEIIDSEESETKKPYKKDSSEDGSPK
ncbi:MAG: signal peptidase I [Nitrosopumilaceae archaeon]|nr:signal peptidase I [Nitrosopumilaceae archaeon]